MAISLESSLVALKAGIVNSSTGVVTLQSGTATGLYVTLSYTKGAEAGILIQFAVNLDYDKTKYFSILASTNPATTFKFDVSASGNYLIPVPVPVHTDKLRLLITNTDGSPFTGTAVIGLTTDEGIAPTK